MTDIRNMELLAALARHGHFARAADECGISQPAFSARIRNLELELGAPIVKRGNRFLGFTREGEIALKWAHRMLADADGLIQEIEEAKGALSGRLVIGAVPTTLTFVAKVPATLRAAHPGLTIQIFSQTSSEIRQGLEDFSLDAGVTYLDGALPASSRSEPLYDERYILLAPPALAPRREGHATWREAANLPLCLLTRNMRNRRIIDDAFDAVGTAPQPVMETNAFTAALVQVTSGAAATIVPELLADSLPVAAGAIRLSLIEPVVEKPIGLVTSDREPELPAVRALVKALLEAAR
jgi:DNA-binding transcriptional LysR family regulator